MPRKHKHDSDSVSELSHDEASTTSSHSNISKSSSYYRAKIKRKLRLGKRSSNDSASAESRSRTATKHRGDAGSATPPAGTKKKARPPGVAAGGGGAPGKTKKQTDTQRLIKDAKSRFNIGLVYLKTGDYAKAQDNLEHSLFCHIQLFGHDSKAYAPATLFAVAGVREKLGDCYTANPAATDKVLALDHYEEARRLLRSVDKEDAPESFTGMLDRIEEKLQQPELKSAGGARRAAAPSTKYADKYQLNGNDKAKAMLGVGAATGAVRPAAADKRGKSPERGKSPGRRKRASGFVFNIAHELHDAIEDVKEKVEDLLDSSSSDGSQRSLRSEEGDVFAAAAAQVQHGSHRTALNALAAQTCLESMQKAKFRAAMARALIDLGESAMAGEKISVATDAYEEAVTVLKREENPGDELKQASRGCIKGHKKVAIEMEDMRDYDAAIQHRTRAYHLLDEETRTVPACEQKVQIAYLLGKNNEHDKSAVELTSTVRRLCQGVASPELMPADRRDLLIQCYRMRAICYAKTQRRREALEDYDAQLPLLAKKEDEGGREYNSAVIHKAALLVAMGKYGQAASTLDKYFQRQGPAGNFIVGDLDYVLALDTLAATQLQRGETDAAVSTFEKKLRLVQTLPDNNEMKSDTLHKLGCLHANGDRHEKALPLLNEALRTKKYAYDDEHKSVLETSWAFAATNHILGNNEQAVQEYMTLLEKTKNVDDLPVDAHLIQSAAGKLFFEDGKLDLAIDTFDQALKSVAVANNPALKGQVLLSLANALSAKGEDERALELYNSIVRKKALKKTKTFFLARYNKSLLLLKMGEVEEGTAILCKLAEARSPNADDVKGGIFLTLGNLALAEGETDEASQYFEESFNAAANDDFAARAHAKRGAALSDLAAGNDKEALGMLEDILEELSEIGVEGKAAHLLKAEIWNSMAQVYKQQLDLPQAINFSKLG